MDTVGSISADTFAIILFCLCLGGFLVGFLLFTLWTRQRKTSDELYNDRINTLNDINRLTSNFDFQAKTYVTPSLILSIHYLWQDKVRLFSQLSLLLFLISLIVLISALSTNNVTITYAGVWCFIVSVSLYLFCRVFRYAQLKRESGAITSQDHALLYGFYYNKSNFVQIGLLVVEFVQLQSYPFRQLINAGSFISTSQKPAVDATLNALLLNVIGSETLFLAEFWSSFIAIMGGFLLTLLIMGYNHLAARRRRILCCGPFQPIPLYWVSYLLPLVSVFYLPVLVSMISSTACVLQINTNSTQCANLSMTLFVALAMTAYFVGYPLLTFFLSSYEKIPVQGDIGFKPVSVVFIKSLSLYLIIVLVLIPDNPSGLFIRGFAAALVMFILFLYSLKKAPSYVYEVNFWRSCSFCCVFLTCVIVIFTAMTNTSSGQTVLQIMGLYVLLLIFGTWLIAFLIFYAIFKTLAIRRQVRK